MRLVCQAPIAMMLIAAGTGVVAGTARGQEAEITAETPVSTAQLRAWLNSDDPRLIAWAADFARRTHDAQIVAEIPPLIERWGVQRISASDVAGAGQGRATTALLDTLIQENAQAPTLMIEAIAESYPAQAAILIARAPMEESRTTLNDWTYEATGPWGARTLARVAAMMLAKEPVGDFAARVTGEAEEELVVRVTSGAGVGGGIGSGFCGDSLGGGTPKGWPEVFAYGLEENSSDANAPLVIDLDGDRISAQRASMDRGSGSCFAVEPLDARTRHRLIAHWLGVRDGEMKWQASESEAIAWKDRPDYERQLGALIEMHREELRGTVATLVQRGVLTESAAGTTPRLVVKIQCDMEPCPLEK
jgi:hypothetical protein